MKKMIVSATLAIMSISVAYAHADRCNTLFYLHQNGMLSAAQYVADAGAFNTEQLNADIALIEQHAQALFTQQEKRKGFVYDKMVPAVLTVGKYGAGLASATGTCAVLSIIFDVVHAWYGPVGREITREIIVEQMAQKGLMAAVEKAVTDQLSTIDKNNKESMRQVMQSISREVSSSLSMNKIEFFIGKWNKLTDPRLGNWDYARRCDEDLEKNKVYWAMKRINELPSMIITAIVGGLIVKKLYNAAVDYAISHKAYIQELRAQWEQDQAIIVHLKQIRYEQLQNIV